MKRLYTLLALVCVAVLAAVALLWWVHRDDNPGCASTSHASGCIRVLFLGNSYTAVNDLPATFTRLAWSGAERAESGAQDPGGWTLAQQAAAASTQTLLSSQPWDFVVLQEQSQIPADAASVRYSMQPAASTLVTMVRAHGSTPLLFATWGHQGGWPENGLPDYPAMQAAINSGYQQIAAATGTAVIPVGTAWTQLLALSPKAGLWQSDGSHPTVLGTYLAACTFYAFIFQRSPLGLAYTAGLSAADARAAQLAATKAVLG